MSEIFYPSPTTRVHFADGKVIPMNRGQRRKNRLYGDRVKRLKGKKVIDSGE